MRSFAFFFFLFFSSSLWAQSFTSPSDWTVENVSPARLELQSVDSWLKIEASALTEVTPCRLLLREPLEVPVGCELVWEGTAENVAAIFVRVLAEDAKGNRFLFFPTSRSFCRRGMFLNGYFQGALFRHGEVLFRTEGMRAFRRETFEPLPDSKERIPTAPLRVLGLEFTGEGLNDPKSNVFYFRGFRLTDVTHASSKLYYQFQDVECFGELSGPPSVSYGDFSDLHHLGWDRVNVRWTLRDRFDGEPTVSGSDVLMLDDSPNVLPRVLQMTRRVTFPAQEPGTYWIHVKYEALRKGKSVAEREQDFRLFVIQRDGKRAGSDDSRTVTIPREPVVIPKVEIPEAAEEEPLIYFEAHAGRDHEQEKIRKAMRAVRGITRNFEIHVRWSDVEKTPGVYDFTTMDELFMLARELGTRLQLDVSFDPPEWVPSHYTQNAEGEIFGHSTYLFHGARLNTYHSPVIRPAALEFVRQVVAHFHEKPELLSYYFLIEHPGEAPYRSWFEGFDPFTLANYRAYMKNPSIVPPRHGEEATPREWLDWLVFRTRAVESFREECVAIVRSLDRRHFVMMYGGGSDAMTGSGVLSANGGCDGPRGKAFHEIQVVERGLPQRAEEISVGRWSANGLTQLDVSVFAQMLGGGQNSNCKMFFPADPFFAESATLDDFRKEPFSLDRFERFVPIWRELRPARTLAGDVRFFHDQHGELLHSKTTFEGGDSTWCTTMFLESQVPFWVAPGKNWESARLVVLPSNTLETLERPVLDSLVNYVQNGGNLWMFAENGRVCVEFPADDWFLLRRFGFEPPREFRGGNVSVLLKGTEKAGRAANSWLTEPQGETLAVFENQERTPALSVRSFGKGRVFVFWSKEIPPMGEAHASEPSLLRFVSERCGAFLPVECDSRVIWTNLLRDPQTGTYFLLVMRDREMYEPASVEKPPVSASVRLSLEAGPDVKFEVSELIYGTENRSEVSATELQKAGIPVSLRLREVRIYKIKEKNY